MRAGYEGDQDVRCLREMTKLDSKPSAVYFCGEKSRYGAAHIAPVLNHFEVKAIVLADDARWQRFRKTLHGELPAQKPARLNLRASAKGMLKQILPEAVVRWARPDYRRPQQQNVYRLLQAASVEVRTVFDANDAATLTWMREMDVDLLISAAYPQIFSGDLVSISRKGSVNFHPSLLPKYRGAHPHFWAIAKGDQSSGVTAHFMTAELDQGDIIAQIEVPIDGCTYNEFYNRIVNITPELVERVSKFFQTAEEATPQRDEDASYFRNDRAIHHRVFWTLQDAQQIWNLSRTHMAFCYLGDQRLRILEAEPRRGNRNLTNGVEVEPGTIVDVGREYIDVEATEGCIRLRRIQLGDRLLSGKSLIKLFASQIGRKLN